MSTQVPTPSDPGFWWKLTHLEPSMYRGLVVAAAALLASVGVHFASGIPDAIIGVIVVLVPIVQGLWTRGAVTANDRVVVVAPDPIDQPRFVMPGAASTSAPDKAIVEAARTSLP